jgi:hypothetical protein
VREWVGERRRERVEREGREAEHVPAYKYGE